MFESLRQLLAGLVSGKELKYLDEIGMRPPLFDLEEPQHHHDFHKGTGALEGAAPDNQDGSKIIVGRS
ncbi:Protein of unknown function [Pyronema omphalodes CBS 100304]|uniref:Uncharacterized protein n=1 Tax=Pyronema omphalodes (strain CBS 100304) TaxID=1076935 RepID=U4LAB4_PYROM|nr:Protein of unknown function [Pyronema omphalodes CBS 100304]